MVETCIIAVVFTGSQYDSGLIATGWIAVIGICELLLFELLPPALAVVALYPEVPGSLCIGGRRKIVKGIDAIGVCGIKHGEIRTVDCIGQNPDDSRDACCIAPPCKPKPASLSLPHQVANRAGTCKTKVYSQVTIIAILSLDWVRHHWSR
ncbi:MAG: hypothetical protein IPO69_21315 [Saprospiraceae bacterium]|nr:hypothetical protein [Saprospiraceae bacterium]